MIDKSKDKDIAWCNEDSMIRNSIGCIEMCEKFEELDEDAQKLCLRMLKWAIRYCMDHKKMYKMRALGIDTFWDMLTKNLDLEEDI